MTSANPPYPYFNGITYNSQYFASSGSGLTQSQANALYLRKTTADTATALETFTGGIASNSIQSTTASTDMSIGSSQTSGILNLGTGASRTSAGADVNIATGASNACAVNVMNGNTTAGSVNIANGTGATQTTAVNIASGSTTNTVTIGNPSNTVIIGSGASTLISNQVGMVNSVSILSGGGATTGGSVNIANGSSQTTTVNIATITSTGALIIGNLNNTTDMKSGNVNIQNVGGSGGTVNIKNGTDATGSVNIASGGAIGTPTVAVNIGSGSTNGTITIGNSANTVQINGGLSMGTGKNITLQPTASIVAPTAFTQLGGTSTNKNSITLTLGAAIVVIPVQITRAGTYLFTCGSQLTFTSAFTYFYSNIYESSTAQTLNTVATPGTGIGVIQTQGNFGQQPMGTISGTQIMTTNGSYVYTVPETKANFYYSFVIYALGGGTLGTLNSFMTITRLG